MTALHNKQSFIVIVPGKVPGFVHMISINKTVLYCIEELDGTPGSAGHSL